MPQYRYVAEDERIYLGPPTFVVGPGDVVESHTNPDPLRFTQVEQEPPAKEAKTR